MDISSVLNVKNIKLNMMAKSKEEAIEELADLLVRDGAVINKDIFLKDVWLREEQGSTGFENHIAIPHGKSSGVARTALAIGRAQHHIPGKRWMIVTFVVLFYLLYAWWIKIPPTSDYYPRFQVHLPMKR